MSLRKVLLTELMAYFSDLSQYTYTIEAPPAVNVGWLDPDHPYTHGKMPKGLFAKLRKRALENQVNPMRGFHECVFCLRENRQSRISLNCKGKVRYLGSAEVWVRSHDGTSYAAPNLIVHYIEAHDYLPPKDFLDALAEM